MYHGYDVSSGQSLVLKVYKFQEEEYSTFESYLRKVKVRILCTAYVNMFTEKIATLKLEINPMYVLQCDRDKYYLMENFLVGTMEKYNNNVGVVCSESPLSEIMQAFSHFSWVASKKTLLVCDLQGVESSGPSRVTLTDPSIQWTH